MLIALVCVLATLVVQGLTLAPLVRWLGVGTEADTEEEALQLRRRAASAALEALRNERGDGDDDDPAREAVVQQYQGQLAAQDALSAVREDAGQDGDAHARLQDLIRRAYEVERDLVITARRHGEVSAQAADDVLDDVETRAFRDTD